MALTKFLPWESALRVVGTLYLGKYGILSPRAPVTEIMGTGFYIPYSYIAQ